MDSNVTKYPRPAPTSTVSALVAGSVHDASGDASIAFTIAGRWWHALEFPWHHPLPSPVPPPA